MRHLFPTVGAWASLVSMSIAGSAHAADAQTVKRLEQIPPAYTRNDVFMGTVLVAEGDKVLLEEGYGDADLDWQIPNAPDVKFRIGSLTKQFTAVLILKLQEDGKLSVSDPVTRYLPDVPKSWSTVTLANLLGHTSGIPNFTADPAFDTWSSSPRTHAEELALIESKPLDFSPGTKFHYSNSNYEVLGAVIEKVTGQTYGKVLQDRILLPLSLKDTGLDSDELILPKRAIGYQQQRDSDQLEQARSESMTVPWAAGSLYSTTGDLFRWERALFSGKVLTPASLRLMTSPGKGDYGFGVEVKNEYGHTVISHGGAIEGFTSSLVYVPDQNITLVALSNVAGPIPEFLTKQMLQVALGQSVVLPNEHRAIPATVADLQPFVGRFHSADLGDLSTVIMDGHLVVKRGKTPPRVMVYEGQRNGTASFYVPERFYSVDFIMSGSQPAAKMVLHLIGGDVTAERK